MMFYLGIDQHARQITISLRDENGDVLLACQVSTQPDKIKAFFQKLTRERLGNGDTFVAALEVCGFNDWLIRMLRDYRCQKVILQRLLADIRAGKVDCVVTYKVDRLSR